MIYFAVDTSNYTTSVAAVDENLNVIGKKRLLPVKEGERGLRQSDAVFHHTKAYSFLVEELFSELGNKESIVAVGCSVTPTTQKNSYMPCFSVGESFAKSLSAVLNVPFYPFSHQQGHIAAALYSSGNLEYIKKPFIAFHVSGGTTEAVLCEPDEKEPFKVTPLCSSNDLKAGQAIDRIGVKMGMKFPCGQELEKSALLSDKVYKNKIKLYNGCCSLSGLENKAVKMMENGTPNCDVAKYVFAFIADSLSQMADNLLSCYTDLPLVFSGGVMSNSIIKSIISARFDAVFAQPDFSCDNACGTAVLTFLEANK